MWKDGRCFIIGGGSSIPREFGVPEDVIQSVYSGKLTPSAYSPYMETIQKEHIIMVNMAYRIGNWGDIVFWGDDSFFNRNLTEILNYPAIRATIAPRVNDRYINHVRQLRRDRKQYGITHDPGKLVWNLNSGAAAINLAVQLGVKQIVLLGFDMRLDEKSNQHWHKFYGGNPRTVYSVFKKHLKAFPAIKNDLKGSVEILNCSKDSAIPDFKKVTIKDVL